MTSEGADHDIEGTVVTRLKCEYGSHKAGRLVRDFEGLIGVFN
jgi:hypothetical protein